MNILKFFAVNALVLSALIAGFVYEVDGVRNLFLLFVWGLLLPFSMLSLLVPGFVDVMAKKPATPAPKIIARSISATVFLLLAWTGALATAVAYAVSWALSRIFNETVEKRRAELAAGK